MDHKTRKRIQNRLAQRTYRSRVKQRLDDLQRQVDEHEHQRAQAGSQIVDRSTVAEDSKRSSSPQASSSTAFGTDSDDAGLSVGTTDQPTWTAGSENHDFLQQSISALDSFQWNPPDLNMLPHTPYDACSSSPRFSTQQLQMSNLALDSPRQSSEFGQTPSTKHQSGVTHSAFVTRNVTPVQNIPREGSYCQAALNTSLPECEQISRSSGAESISNLLPKSGSDLLPEANLIRTSAGVASIQTSCIAAVSDLTKDTQFTPGVENTAEEKFEYLMTCARKVGFDTFDDLASQYYAMDFDHTSPLALEQQISRYRHLPKFMLELRQRSKTWMPWERRGYENEILKTAKELCASDCTNFMGNGDMMNPQSRLEMSSQNNYVGPVPNHR